MMKINNWRRCLGSQILALILVQVFGSVAANSAEPKRGGTLRFAVRKNLSTLNPFLLMQSVDHRVRSLVYEGLLAYDRNLEPMPALARSWSLSPDGMTYTFNLRPGVKLHHGRALSPKDIQWSIEYTQDPKNRAFGREELTIIEKTEVEEPDRIRIKLKSPFAAMLGTLAGIDLFPVVPQGSVQPGDSQPDTLPPGTGPFRFVEWKAGQEMRLARFEGYWQKGLPYIEEVRFLVVPDETVRMSALRVGDLDIAEEIPGDQVLRIREGKAPGLGVAIASAGIIRRININHCRPPFNSLKVRQALALALNQQEIIDGAYFGLGSPTNQRLQKESKWFIPELPERRQDLDKARALLAEAGYPKGVKATIDAAAGGERELQMIQFQAKKTGIDLTMQILDAATYNARHQRGEHQITTAGAYTASDPDLTYYGYYRTPPPDRRHLGGRTQPCYSNSRVDELLDEARKVADFQRRRRMYKEVIEILYEEVPDILIGFRGNGFGFQVHVRDFEPTITSVYSYGNGGLHRTWLDR
jgi:peptide/nickel transport system substrate-binding protein